MLGAVLFNAVEIRANISKDLGFSVEDRIEHARRMGWLCDRLVEADVTAIADFICPTDATRAAFGEAFIVWVNRIESSRFPDTNKLFVAPRHYDIQIPPEGSAREWAARVAAAIKSGRRPEIPS